jgi:hypothetical protein
MSALVSFSAARADTQSITAANAVGLMVDLLYVRELSGLRRSLERVRDRETVRAETGEFIITNEVFGEKEFSRTVNWWPSVRSL